MTTPQTRHQFTALHQQFDEQIMVEPSRFRALIEDGGIERIIAATKTTPQGSRGVLITPQTIDGEPIEFHSYAYLSTADIVNIWSEAHADPHGEPRLLAICRLGWADPRTINDENHVHLSQMLQQVLSE